MREQESSGKNIALWVLCVLLALPFLGSGGAKLAGTPLMVAIFQKIGLGQWFRLLTGLLEVFGATGLLFPHYRQMSAALLALVMLGAIGFHLMILGGNSAGPVVLFVVSALVTWLSGKRVQST
jgi:putative oxidoreductase